MPSKTHTINSILKQYISLLKKNIALDKVILFGSYADGKAHKYSDIDVAIFSNDFNNKNEIEILQDLFRLACTIDSRIEPIAFLPNEIKNTKYNPILKNIMKKGKIIYQ